MDESYNSEGTVQVDLPEDYLDPKYDLVQEKVTLRTYQAMKSYESPVHWVDNLEDLTIGRISRAIRLISDELDGKTEGMADHVGMTCIVRRVLRSFFLALLHRFEECKEAISKASDELIYMWKNKRVKKEHLVGLNHLLGGVILYNRLQEQFRRGQLTNSSTSTGGMTLNDDNSTRAVIVFAQHQFLWWIQGKWADNLLDQVIELDPGFHWWYVCKYDECCAKRKGRVFPVSRSPSEDEIVAICKALEVARAEPLVLLYYCMCLGELMRANGWKSGVNFGDRKFNSAKEVLAFTTCTMVELYSKLKENAWANVRLAMFFATILPEEHGNILMAKKCLERNMRIHPKWPISYRRMGTILFKEEPTVRNATRFYAKALDLEPTNVIYRIELVKAYLSAPDEDGNALEILRLLEENDFWKADRAEQHFLRGCYYLTAKSIVDQKKLFVLEWVKSCQASVDCVDFKRLPGTIHRWRWDPKLFVAPRIFQAMAEAVESGIVSRDDEAFVTLEKTLTGINLPKQRRERSKKGSEQPRERSENSSEQQRERSKNGSESSDDPERMMSKGKNNRRRRSNKGSSAKESSTSSPTTANGGLRKKFFNSINSVSNGLKVMVIRQPFGPDGTNGFAWPLRIN